MKQELTDMLLEYYGELMQERDSIGCHDWGKRDDIVHKMNAISVLLTLKTKQQTTMQTITEILKSRQ